MRHDESAEIAAVAVMRLLRTSPLQMLYAVSVMQRSSVGQTHVPPESARMEALTEIWVVHVWVLVLWVCGGVGEKERRGETREGK